MPVTANPRFNDPALGAAFQSLSQIFQPPSGSDLAGYATAKAKKEEAQRLADLFDYAHSQDFNQSTFDRLGQASGQWTPSTGYYGVDVGAETVRRGQDITAETSRANNTADNARAIQTNAADNERALKIGAMDNERQSITSLFGPLNEGQIRPAVPADIAAHVGLPAIEQANGVPKPLTETEWQAQQNERLRQGGTLTDQMLLGAIVGDKTPVQAIGPNGKPQFMTPGAAVLSGAEPYNPSADKSLVEGTTVIDGKSVQVFRKPGESAYFMADGKPVPADVQVYDKAKPTGTNEQLGMKPTEFTQKNAMFYNRAASADANLTKLQNEKGYVPNARDFEMMLGKAGDLLPLSLSNNLVSPDGRQFYNSAMNFMLSILRPDTGAAFSREEFQNYSRVFIPIPGDDPDTLASKATARATALAALQGSSAGAADQITRIMQANGVDVPPEMLAHMQAAQQAATAGNQAPAANSSVASPPAVDDPIARARKAIADGAPRDAVIKRLRDNGIDPVGL
ncbi:hypothetical protein [Rhizobium sp. WYJ-E13]|uniref:hypothetical protein n=1 Tax=Rhizobium sp. WYJ-E13 TaxID=2849093 RepID=UPI001C1EC55A|nr:hypothetical protein [Rhizobium sp. WYJ-E13]QWW67963.1 hypothetical protein KQ933_20655 [Rhizobium sp. WYJ-E13]